MKPTTLLLAFVALTSADLIPRDNSTSVSSSPPSTTTWALTPAQICLQSCTAGDVNCQAACVGSAHPNSIQVSETNDCIGKCPQGNGTDAESSDYASCLQACIASYYPTSQTVGVVEGGSTLASNAATATGTGTAGAAATGTGAKSSSSSTATGSATTTSASKAAATNIGPLLGSAGGLAGLFMAFLAL